MKKRENKLEAESVEQGDYKSDLDPIVAEVLAYVGGQGEPAEYVAKALRRYRKAERESKEAASGPDLLREITVLSPALEEARTEALRLAAVPVCSKCNFSAASESRSTFGALKRRVNTLTADLAARRTTIASAQTACRAASSSLRSACSAAIGRAVERLAPQFGELLRDEDAELVSVPEVRRLWMSVTKGLDLAVRLGVDAPVTATAVLESLPPAQAVVLARVVGLHFVIPERSPSSFAPPRLPDGVPESF